MQLLHRKLLHNLCRVFPDYKESSYHIVQGDTAQNPLQRKWGNFPFANWNGNCWGLPLQLVQLIKIHFLPHLESFMWERKFEKKFFKKSLIQPPNGVFFIFKLPFPNGSYRNGVCRALWALHPKRSTPFGVCTWFFWKKSFQISVLT